MKHHTDVLMFMPKFEIQTLIHSFLNNKQDASLTMLQAPLWGRYLQQSYLPVMAPLTRGSACTQETSVAGLLSLLTAMLLHASPSCAPGEASPEALPVNFVETALCVMRVLCNIARLDLLAAQKLLSSTNNRVEFFHLIGFLLSYCTSQWPGASSNGSITSAADLLAASLPAAAGERAAASKSPTAAAAGRGSVGAPPSAAPTAASHASLSGSTYAAKLLSKPPGPAPPSASSQASGPKSHHHSSAARLASNPPVPAGMAAAAAAAAARHTSAQQVLLGAVMHSIDHPIAELLNEVILLLGYFALLSPTNQAILQWGKHPSILLRLCAVPFPYFSHPLLKHVLMPTLLSACYNAERACEAMEPFLNYSCLIGYLEEEEAEMDRLALAPIISSSSSSNGSASAAAATAGAANSTGAARDGGGSGGGAAFMSTDEALVGSLGMPDYFVQSYRRQLAPKFALTRRFPEELLQDAKDYFKSRAECSIWMNVADGGSGSSSGQD